MFSGLVEKNKSLGAPVNSSLWGVHLNKQLSFENGLYCVRLLILQSGGCVKLIKPEELWVIMSEDYCPSCDYLPAVFPGTGAHALAFPSWQHCGPRGPTLPLLASSRHHLCDSAQAAHPQVLGSQEMPGECPAGLRGCRFQVLLTNR